MKMQLVTLLATACLLLGSTVVKAASETQAWVETTKTKSGMAEFETAVKNAGYIDDGGNISVEGIGYAGIHVIKEHSLVSVETMVPKTYLSYAGIGRLLLIYNRLYNADGSVRSGVHRDDFVTIGQGVGWYVPTSSYAMQRLVSVDQTLKTIKRRADSGTMVASDLEIVNQFLYKLTGRTGLGQINPERIDAMDRRIHEIQDGEWTNAMKKAARTEAVAATASDFKKLKDDQDALAKENKDLKKRLQDVEDKLGSHDDLNGSHAEAIVENTVALTKLQTSVSDSVSESLSSFEKTMERKFDDRDTEARKFSQRSERIDLALGIVISLLIFTAIYAYWRRRKSAAKSASTGGEADNPYPKNQSGEAAPAKPADA